MKTIQCPRRGGAAVVALGLVVVLTGCQLANRSYPVSSHAVAPAATRSALVAVVANPAAGPSLARLVAASVRPGENIDVLGSGATAAVLVAGSSPEPAAATVPSRPASPGAGATPFQRAEYQRSLARWQRLAAAAKQVAARRTGAELSAWVSGLGVSARVGRLPQAGAAVDLATESATAASAVADLDQVAGANYGGQRVILLFPSDLRGTLPPGQLTGDDVIVVTAFAPSAAAASSAQAMLLSAGAGAASVLGPEYTVAQLSQAVSVGLSRPMTTDVLSGAALFANNSSKLEHAAARVLSPLIVPLRRPGYSAIINGYASTTGSDQLNYLLSYARADAVARFYESHGVLDSSLQVVGHGATGLVASGSSGANRRVVVVLEGPAQD